MSLSASALKPSRFRPGLLVARLGSKSSLLGDSPNIAALNSTVSYDSSRPSSQTTSPTTSPSTETPLLSPLEWAKQNATIVLPTEGRQPFLPYSYQAALLEDRSPRRIVLKARQT